MEKKKFKTVDEYIKTFPNQKQTLLQEIRKAIQEVAPEAEEGISYQIPTYKQNGVLLSFAAFDKHIGLYPTPSGIEQFKTELAHYKSAKGSVRLPLNEPIPIELIKKITAFRLKENSSKNK